MKTTFLYLNLIFSATACQVSWSQQTGDQGVYGKIFWLEGNQMPGPGRPPSQGEPVVRTIWVYPLLKAGELDRMEALFSKPDLEAIASTKSNDQGEFKLALPVGNYSILIQEEEGYFAGLFDGDNHVNPVTVESQKYSEFNIKIDYKASY